MGKLISLIYFYLVSVIAILLLIIGLYNLVSFGINTVFYDDYPLSYGSEDCSYLTQTAPIKPLPEATDSLASISAEQAQEQKIACENRIIAERKRTQVNDIKNGIYFTLIGTILLSLHFPIALRRSAEK
jgi:hypothetical protein